jgi:hypothetical protein
MIRFNDIWGIDTRMQIEPNSYPLRGIECAEKPQGKAFSVFHGYDRNWLLKSMFEFKYREGSDFNLEEFKRWNEELTLRQPPERRGLRRLSREGIAISNQLPHPGRVFIRHT